MEKFANINHNHLGKAVLGSVTSKRAFDVVLSVLALLLLSPLFLLISIMVRICVGRPVLFSQTRAGRYGEPFTLLKFRTMTNVVDEDGNLLPAAQRLTALGRFLRRTSLDELPEFVNVLRGDMSLVGPRPLFVKYIPLYSEYEAKRLSVLPGLSGWAQVNGRNGLSWPERFKLDVWYVDNQSLVLDLRILAMTVKTIATGKGVKFSNGSISDPFLGSENHYSDRESSN